jgi:hypothetical protein
MVFKRIIATLTLLSFLICLHGCYSTRVAPRQEVEGYPGYRITKVTTVDGEVIEFDTEKSEGARIIDGKIEGLSKDGSFRSIVLSQVVTVEIRKIDTTETSFAVFGVLLLALVVFVLILAASWSYEMGAPNP